MKNKNFKIEIEIIDNTVEIFTNVVQNDKPKNLSYEVSANNLTSLEDAKLFYSIIEYLEKQIKI